MIGRSLLLAGYFFLFAGQFNGRYFTIANFYVYSGSPVAGYHAGIVSRPSQPAVVNKAAAQHGIALRDNSQRPAHLGIDKRYGFKQGIRVPQVRAPEVEYAAIVKIRLYTQTPACHFIDLPVNAQRGPPRA